MLIVLALLAAFDSDWELRGGRPRTAGSAFYLPLLQIAVYGDHPDKFSSASI